MTDTAVEQIVAALQSDRAGEAEHLCRQQLNRKPDDFEVLILLAVSLWRLGDQPGALEVYSRLTQLHPDDVMHWRNYATALRLSGDLAKAEEASAVAVRLAPDDAELLELHGLLLMDMSRHVEARDTLLRAFGQSPDSPAIRIHAALACVACRDSRAENLLRPWRQWMPLDDDTLESELAEAHMQQGDVLAAVELLEGLVHRRPEQWRLRLRLAGLYERVNRLEDAEALLEGVASELVRTDQQSREAREVIQQRARLAERSGHYAAAREAMEHMGPRGERDCAYWFELAKVRDKLGDVHAAMSALEHAHALQTSDIKAHHPEWFEPGARTLPNQNPRVTASDYATWPILTAPDAAQSPIFVVGFPRSGTTLLEQMLDAHPRLQSMDERPFFNMLAGQLANSTSFEVPQDLGRLDQRDCDELRKGYLTFACSKVLRRWDARLVDKNPMNMLWLPMIYRLFPNAKFILAVRHPCDVLLSNYMQNFMASTLGVVCENLQTLATAYVDAMGHWLYHVDLFKPDVLVSRYEDLVTDPARQARLIAEHLNLDGADAMLGFQQRAREKGFIATPSYTQVIEPINNKAISRWQRYREYFEPVLPTLAPMLQHWGYSTESKAAEHV